MPYTPDQLFDMVGNVETYPQFIPWITDLQTWNRRETGEGRAVLDAECSVKFAFIRERFATRVRLDRPNLTINVDLLDGPFRRLENLWRFELHPEGAQLTFFIDFEFRSRLLERLLQANLGTASNRLIKCFENRAAALYGPGAL